MCSVKFTFFDIVVIFLFTVKSIAIDIQSGFWTLSRLFLCKTQQALCMTQRDSLSVRCQDRGPSIIYVVFEEGEGVSPNLLIKKTTKGEGGGQ